MSYKIQNRSPASKRLKFIKRTDGRVSFVGNPVPTYQENTIQAGWCMAAITPVPTLPDPQTTFELSAAPMGTDGRVSLYRNGTLVSSMRYNNLKSNAEKVSWFNGFFGVAVLMAIVMGITVFTIREEESVIQLVFEDDDIDYIDNDIHGWDVTRTAFFREQYRLAIAVKLTDIDCTGALNFAGELDISETAGSKLVGEDGSAFTVTDDVNFIEILRTAFGLEVVELTPYGPPLPSPDEMHFTTIDGTINYTGVVGDVITLSDGSLINLEVDSIEALTVPAGKHKIKLNGSRSGGYISLGGVALVEVHNFPSLETIYKIDFYPNVSSPNLIKVPTYLPSNVTDLSVMFFRATTFNQDISGWDVSNVTSMTGMFGEAYAFNQSLNAWNTGHVTNMRAMFINAAAFNQPLNDWNVGAVVNMDSMFYNAYAFNQPLNLWNTSKVTNMDAMFNTTNNFNQDLSGWCVTNITSRPPGFRSSSRLTEANLPVWGTCPRGENLISE